MSRTAADFDEGSLLSPILWGPISESPAGDSIGVRREWKFTRAARNCLKMGSVFCFVFVVVVVIFLGLPIIGSRPDDTFFIVPRTV